MGRNLISIDPGNLLEMAQKGMTQKEMAAEIGISTPTLAKRLASLRDKQGLLLKYRELQNLELTAIQARVLEAITPEKIDEAPLRDLVIAFKVLKDKELTLSGKPSEIKGLVGYLINLEKEEAVAKAIDTEVKPMADAIVDAEEVDEDDLPNL